MSNIFDLRERKFDMSFQEKSNLAMTVIFALVYGAYFATVLPPALAGEASLDAVKGLLFGAVVFLVVGGVVAHILIAVASPKDTDAADERDKLIEMRADARTSYLIGAGALLAMGLALLDADVFWIAHILLAALVLSELAKGVFRAIDYRRGV
jgi:hypothetical protein